MKKIFSITTACVSGVILIFLLVMGVVKRNVRFEYSQPVTISVYNKSTNPTKANGYSKDDSEYTDILNQLNNVTNLSLLEWLLGCNSITTTVSQDLDQNFATYKTDMLVENLAIELVFENEQDAIVTIDGNTKVLSFWCAMFIFPNTNSFTDVIVYFSTTSSTTNRVASYQTYRPITMKGKTKNIYNYVNNNLV